MSADTLVRHNTIEGNDVLEVPLVEDNYAMVFVLPNVNSGTNFKRMNDSNFLLYDIKTHSPWVAVNLCTICPSCFFSISILSFLWVSTNHNVTFILYINFFCLKPPSYIFLILK